MRVFFRWTRSILSVVLLSYFSHVPTGIAGALDDRGSKTDSMMYAITKDLDFSIPTDRRGGITASDPNVVILGTEGEDYVKEGSFIYRGNFTVTTDRRADITFIDTEGFQTNLNVLGSAVVGAIGNTNKGALGKHTITVTKGSNLTLGVVKDVRLSEDDKIKPEDFSALGVINMEQNSSITIGVNKIGNNIDTVFTHPADKSDLLQVSSRLLTLRDESIKDFGMIDAGGILAIDNKNGNPIIFNNPITPLIYWYKECMLYIIAATPVTIRDAAFFTNTKILDGTVNPEPTLGGGRGFFIGKIHDFDESMFKTSTPSTLTIQSDKNIDISSITFMHQDSVLILSSDRAQVKYSNQVQYTGRGHVPNKLGGGRGVSILTSFSENPIDAYGVVELNNTSKSLFELEGGSIGFDSKNRAKELRITGNSEIKVNAPIFTKKISLDSSDKLSITQPISLGTDSTIEVKQDSYIQGGGISGSAVTIDLQSNKLSLAEGDVTISDSLKINTQFNSADNKGGSIVIDKGVLDLLQTKTMTVNLIANSGLPAHGSEYQYKLLNGDIKQVPEMSISFEAKEQNKLITWQYDATNHVLSTKTDVSKLPVIIDNNNTSNNTKKITTELVDSHKKQNLTSTEMLNGLASMEQRDIELALKQLTPVLEKINDEANDAANNSILNRVMNSLPESINYAQNGDSGIAAGDADFTKYGVWISPFYQRASQKQRVGELGYTGKSYGATIGADSMISDNCTVGVAWSNLNLKLTHSDSKVGGHSKVDSNILSLYGLMNLTKETFITSVASLGFSNVHNKETRQITTRLKQTASGKYDSRLYALQVLGGKAIKIANNFTITPLAGIRYTSFHDKGYTETGASIQNLSISKRSSSDIEAVIGTKLAATYNLNGYQLIPELSGSMNINLMNKVPVSYIMNPAFSNPIRLEGAKTTSAWYGVGSKLGIVKNAMEYGIAYEAQLATKYISHQGVLNMRVNF